MTALKPVSYRPSAARRRTYDQIYAIYREIT